MTEAQLIANHIAQHGVTHCPPFTHAMPAVETWEELRRREWAINARRRRFEKARARQQRECVKARKEGMA